MTHPASPLPAAIAGLTDAAVLAVARCQDGMGDCTLRGWRSEPVWTPRLASTAGVHRIDCELEVGAASTGLSLVLKVVTRPASGQLPWEAIVYASGALDDLPDGLQAPRWHGNLNLGPHRIGIWLDVIPDDIGDWDIERFGIAARHLGRLAGSASASLTALARERPVRSFWTDRQYVAKTVGTFRAAPAGDVVRRAWPDTTRRALGTVWSRREPVLERAAHLPVTLCHGDAQRHNLFAHGDPCGTMAIDWANLSRATIGMDLATLVHYAVAYFHVAAYDIMRLERVAIDGYIRGLRDQGMHVDAETVWFGYAAHLVFGVGLLEIGPVLRLVTDASSHATAEIFYGRPVDEILERRAVLAEHLVTLGDAAIRWTARSRRDTGPAAVEHRSR